MVSEVSKPEHGANKLRGKSLRSLHEENEKPYEN